MKRGTYAAWLRMAKFETIDWDRGYWRLMTETVEEAGAMLDEGERVNVDEFFPWFCMYVTRPCNVGTGVQIETDRAFHREGYRYLKLFLAQPQQTAHRGRIGATNE